jgi:hypothetical protein
MYTDFTILSYGIDVYDTITPTVSKQTLPCSNYGITTATTCYVYSVQAAGTLIVPGPFKSLQFKIVNDESNFGFTVRFMRLFLK